MPFTYLSSILFFWWTALFSPRSQKLQYSDYRPHPNQVYLAW